LFVATIRVRIQSKYGISRANVISTTEVEKVTNGIIRTRSTSIEYRSNLAKFALGFLDSFFANFSNTVLHPTISTPNMTHSTAALEREHQVLEGKWRTRKEVSFVVSKDESFYREACISGLHIVPSISSDRALGSDGRKE
jgi:hypothetical protein